MYIWSYLFTDFELKFSARQLALQVRLSQGLDHIEQESGSQGLMICIYIYAYHCLSLFAFKDVLSHVGWWESNGLVPLANQGMSSDELGWALSAHATESSLTCGPQVEETTSESQKNHFIIFLSFFFGQHGHVDLGHSRCSWDLGNRNPIPTLTTWPKRDD